MIGMLRRVIYWLATTGCSILFIFALLPTLCYFEPVMPFVLMAGLALLAMVCGTGARRIYPIIALMVGLTGSVHAYRSNVRKIAQMREIRLKTEAHIRQMMAEATTNDVPVTQTNALAASQPDPSPFWCCF